MRYPAIGGERAWRVTVPALDGGLHTERRADAIGDSQLSGCVNMWFRNGRLETRPGFRTGPGDIPGGSGWDADYVSGDGCRLYKTGLYYDAYEVRRTVAVISLDDTVKGDCSFRSEGGAGCLIEYGAGAQIPGAEPDEAGLLVFSDDGTVFAVSPDCSSARRVDEDAYAPLVYTGGRATGDYGQGGTPSYQMRVFEGFNLLTNRFRAAFTTDGEGALFYLPFGRFERLPERAVYTHRDGTAYTWTWDPADMPDTAAGQAERIYSENTQQIDGEAVYATFQPSDGSFWFCRKDSAVTFTTVVLPDIGVSDNLEVTAFRNGESGAKRIGGMRAAVWFGGTSGGTRLFLAGHPDYPNEVRYSDLNNPLYFPENSFFCVGSSDQRVTGFAKQGRLLVIFKEREIYAAEYVFEEAEAADVLNGEQVDVTRSVYFPVMQLHAGIGCDRPATVQLCGNRLVWASSDGRVHALMSAGETSERAVRELSRPVETALRQADFSSASAACYAGYYLLLCGRQVFLFDYRDSGFSHMAGEAAGERAAEALAWYIWEMDEGAGFRRIWSDGKSCGFLGGRVYRLGGQTDAVPGDGSAPIRERRIRCGFRTRLFDSGQAERRMRVEHVYLGVETAADSEARLCWMTEAGEGSEAVLLPQETADGSGYPVRHLTPYLVRRRLFGLGVDCDGWMAVSGLVFHYSLLGRVR